MNFGWSSLKIGGVDMGAAVKIEEQARRATSAPLVASLAASCEFGFDMTPDEANLFAEALGDLEPPTSYDVLWSRGADRWTLRMLREATTFDPFTSTLRMLPITGCRMADGRWSRHDPSPVRCAWVENA